MDGMVTNPKLCGVGRFVCVAPRSGNHECVPNAMLSSRVRPTRTQIYAIDPVMDYVRPWKRLLAFKRVALPAGASARVAIEVTPEQLAFQDDSSAAGMWRVVPGTYQIRVGNSSLADTLVADVDLKV